MRPLAETLVDRRASESSPGPLDATNGPRAEGDHPGGEPQLWTLAQAATQLLARVFSKPRLRGGLAEAVAALQHLALELAPDSGGDDREARVTRLRELQADVPLGIQVTTDGPYLLSNATRINNWLGEALEARPQMALCRCGASAIKPLCDGSHARVGFSGAKDPNRVPDRRHSYVGQQLTVLDNRGTCQHSGYRTDRLAGVFHLGEEPFVTPSGGRMDEIIRAVRDCPSGALGYALDDVEARETVDYHGRRDRRSS